MKASSRQGFGIWRKLDKFPDLLLAYIWNLAQCGLLLPHVFRGLGYSQRDGVDQDGLVD